MSAPQDQLQPLLALRGLDLDSPGGRPLVRGLKLRLDPGDRAALIGRNGAGKSTLLAHLERSARARTGSGSVALVRQHPERPATCRAAQGLERRSLREPAFAATLARELDALGLAPSLLGRAQAGLSRGEGRKLQLIAARHGGAALLLLDEPTQDLDEAGARWLLDWLPRWPGALLVASHSPRLLSTFAHFFVLAEAGCRHLSGSFAELQGQLEDEASAQQRRYVAGLSELTRRERHNVAVNHRRARKKRLGRLHELARRSPRSRLNQKRSYAQESQARVAKIRAERIGQARDLAKAARRALRVDLPLEALRAQLPPDDGLPLVALEGVGLRAGGRTLVTGLSRSVGRERLALVGPNGSGKTTLLQTMLGERRPDEGRATQRPAKIGSIAQGAVNWMIEDSLLEHLHDHSDARDFAELGAWLVAHRFPLALADRPLASLSPGERVRAALICLFHRSPAVELLVLDEPNFSLDLLGLSALIATLRAWPGGLLVASHDPEFLAALELDEELAMGR